MDHLSAWVELARELKLMGYEFTTVTPETHRRVLQRQPQKITLHDVFGWSREFYLEDLSQKFIRLLEAA